jgi:hypothetical protein
MNGTGALRSSSQRPLGQSSRVAFRLTGTGSRQVGLPVRIPVGWHGGTRIGSQFWISCDIWLSFAVMLQEKPRPWLGVRGEAEISGYKTHSRKRLPRQSNSGPGDWFRCQTRKAPPKRGQGLGVVSRKAGIGSSATGQFGAWRLVPWRQTLGARVLPRSNRRPVTHSSPPKADHCEGRVGSRESPASLGERGFQGHASRGRIPVFRSRAIRDAGIRFRLAGKESPAEAGQGLSWKENQDEATATITKIAAVLRLEVEVRKYLACRATNSKIRRLLSADGPPFRPRMRASLVARL